MIVGIGYWGHYSEERGGVSEGDVKIFIENSDEQEKDLIEMENKAKENVEKSQQKMKDNFSKQNQHLLGPA